MESRRGSNPTKWCGAVITLLTVIADLAPCAAGLNRRLKPTHNGAPQNLEALSPSSYTKHTRTVGPFASSHSQSAGAPPQSIKWALKLLSPTSLTSPISIFSSSTPLAWTSVPLCVRPSTGSETLTFPSLTGDETHNLSIYLSVLDGWEDDSFGHPGVQTLH